MTPDQHVEVPVPEEAYRAAWDAIGSAISWDDVPPASRLSFKRQIDAAALFIAARAVEEERESKAAMQKTVGFLERERADLRNERDQAVQQEREALTLARAALREPGAGEQIRLQAFHAVAAALDDQEGDGNG